MYGFQFISILVDDKANLNVVEQTLQQFQIK